jgi:hypothetical protein
MDRSDNMNRTRWLVVGIVVLRAIVFLAALIVASRLRLGGTIIQAEAAMFTAIVVWLLMLELLPRLRDEGFAALGAPRGIGRISLSALAMLGIVLGVGIIGVVGRNLVFGGTLAVALLLALEFSSGVVLSSFGFSMRRAIESSAMRRPLVDLVLGAQILTALVTVTIVLSTRFFAAPALMRLVAFAPIIALGFFALGVIAHLALSAMKSAKTPVAA